MNQISNTRLIQIAIVFYLFQKSLETEDITKELSETDDEEFDFSRIRCPLCKWQPNSSCRWYCGDCVYPENFPIGCGTSWNTFETHGLCPGCLHQWRWTSCLSCGEWSLHEDWYVNEKG